LEDHVKNEDTTMEVTQGAPFESFGLSDATMRAIRNKHYAVSTPVQAGCIPPMLAGKDVIAKAPTGTGKTMAFGIPIIERIDREIAECISTGMVHDTGVFQYSCTSRKTMEIAGKLIEKGINFPKIVDETFFTKTYNQNRIMGLALMKSVLHLDGKCISSVITKQEMQEYDVLPKHLDGIVSQLRVTKDVEVAIFLYELEDGEFKVSTRSKELVDLSEIAVKFDGGGHVRAAGFSMKGEPEQIIEAILQEVKKQL